MYNIPESRMNLSGYNRYEMKLTLSVALMERQIHYNSIDLYYGPNPSLSNDRLGLST